MCADWQESQLVSYIQNSSHLCELIGTVSQTAHAVNESTDAWGLFFMIDNPRMRTQMNEPSYLFVAITKAPKAAFDQVRASDIVILPCDVTLLDEAAHGDCNASPR